VDLRGPTFKGREGRKDGREGQGKERREGKNPLLRRWGGGE